MKATTPEQLVDLLTTYNQAYRRGAPLVSDAEYDALVEQLRRLAPEHPFLQAVEPEQFSGRRQVRHPTPMLSIDKAYNRQQLERFAARVQKEADQLGIASSTFRLTPKLDGLAGRDDGTVFASRGDGELGYEISSAFEKGVIPIGGRGRGVGEIVVVKSYFDRHMAPFFEHPRNMVVGIVASETLNPNAQSALDDGMVHFVPYDQVPSCVVDTRRLLEQTPQLVQELLAGVDYPTDGIVAEATDPVLKERLGATAHHYRWQIAIKTKGQTARTTVTGIQWQVGRTGNVTPVLEVQPVTVSGATIRRVTAHHAGNIRQSQIGIGSRIEIIRSGEVIPKLEAVLEARGIPNLPDRCPVCADPLVWRNDFLSCANVGCRAQIEHRISHWFRILGNADWFGIQTVRKIVANGHERLDAIYRLCEADFGAMGFGPLQSKNLAEAITLSRSRPVADWRFLAAFGISNLGTGDSRKLLTQIPIEAVPALSEAQIAAIKGFGEVTAKRIADDLERLRPLITHMLHLGFNLQRTPLSSQPPTGTSPIAGKQIVFSGKMTNRSRQEMQAQAHDLGAVVQTALSADTDYLVCGEKPGAAKLNRARALGVTILNERQYLDRLAETGRRGNDDGSHDPPP